MQAGTMDLMQIHNLVDVHTHTATLEEWKRQGTVRYLGITHYHEGAHSELERLIATHRYDFVQLNYCMAERTAERRLLPLARDTGVAVIVNRPFAQASLLSRVRGKALPPWAAEFDCSSWSQFFLKYVVSHPAVTCAIPATSGTTRWPAMGACPTSSCVCAWFAISRVCDAAAGWRDAGPPLRGPREKS
jgi:diketogulonate reductase-like aldo/keto reductase